MVTYEEMNVKSDAAHALILEYSTGGKGKRSSKWLSRLRKLVRSYHLMASNSNTA